MASRDERPRSIGERVKHARKSMGLSQEEFAWRLGQKTHRQVNRWENDHSKPDKKYRVKLAELTGFPEDYFREDVAEKQQLAQVVGHLQSLYETLRGDVDAQAVRLAEIESLARDLLRQMTVFGGSVGT